MRLLPGAILPCLLLAGAVARAAGGTALDAYNFVTGARAAGMGGAALAVVSDPTALQWNPSRLAGIPWYAASVTHLMWVAGIKYSYLGGAVPVPAGFAGLPISMTSGLSVQMLDYGPIESTQGLERAVDASDLGLTVGAGALMTKKLSAGCALKYWRHVLAGDSVSEAALDLGGAYDLDPDRMRIAAVVQNIGYSGKLGVQRAPMPMSLKIGGAYRMSRRKEAQYDEDEPWRPDIHALVASDLTIYKLRDQADYNVGVEVDMNNLLYARIGYLRTVSEAGNFAGWNFGIGVWVFGLRLDYAFGTVGYLGQAQYVTLSWVPKARAKIEEPGKAAENTGAVTAAAVNPDELYSSATGLYNAGRYAEALAKMEEAVKARPEFWEAWQVIGNAKYALNDKEGAIAAYRRALEINPANTGLADWLKTMESSRP